MKTVYLNWSNKPLEVVSEFNYNDDTLYVLHEEGDYNDSFRVVRKDQCRGKEDTAIYKLNEEIKELKSKKEEKMKEIQDEAIKTLASRIRINVAFGGANTQSLIALQLVEELEKIIKDKNK